jgi:hypothetical protein
MNAVNCTFFVIELFSEKRELKCPGYLREARRYFLPNVPYFKFGKLRLKNHSRTKVFPRNVIWGPSGSVIICTDPDPRSTGIILRNILDFYIFMISS